MADQPSTALGGLSEFKWLEQKQKELSNQGDVKVFESVKIDKSYRFGIGLHIIVSVENITVDTINHFILDFLGQGEEASQSSQALTFPADEIEWNVGISNAIAEPWEWLKIRQLSSKGSDKEHENK